jgi:AcrR family transcriptional regulator
MTRQRLSREQSREQTRERLLEAASAIFTKKGYANASVEDIAAAAGYTRGAFYSNFASKTELFFDLLRRESGKINDEFHRILENPVEASELENRLAAYYSQLYRADMCSMLWIEAKMVAVRDVRFRSKLNAFLTEKQNQIVEFIEIFSRLTGQPPAAPAQDIALGLLALCEGVAFAHRCDPQRVDDDTAQSVLSWFMRAAIFAPPGLDRD